MPETGFALGFLVTGYFAVYRYIITNSVVRRANGHPQYFLAAAGGVVLFVESAFIVHIFYGRFSGVLEYRTYIDLFLPYFSDSFTLERRSFLLAQAAALSSILCFILPGLLNFPLRRNHGLAELFAARSGDVGQFESLLYRSIRRQQPLMVSQSNGKVYVGYALNSGSNERTGWIRLQPVFSGYRSNDQKFIITTDYTWIKDLPGESGRNEREDCPFAADFSILVRVDTITSIHAYDLRTHNNQEYFDYAPTPLAAAIKPEGVSIGDDLRGFAKPYLPDWYHQPLNWDPPFIENEELNRRKALYSDLYGEGEPVTFTTFRVSASFQRYIYLVYAFCIIFIPAIAAAGVFSSLWLWFAILAICLIATCKYDNRL